MTVTVELLGMVRRRAGRSRFEVDAVTLDALLGALARECPELDGYCLDSAGLKPGFLLSLNGERFTRGGTALLSDGDQILLLSADAGG